VPYTNEQIDTALEVQRSQADNVVADLKAQGVEVAWNSDLVALISYLQRLGRDTGVPYQSPKPALSLNGEVAPAGGQP